MNDERFEDLLEEIRDEDVPREEFHAARDRVWQKLQPEEHVACDELRPELRAYHLGTIAPARRLLINDHLSRCVECRRALADIKRAGKVVPMPARPQRHSSWQRWAAAAAIVVALLYGARGTIDSMLAPSGPAATVVTVSGSLYSPNGALLPVGTELPEGQSIRTAAGSRAVLRLRDGSEVEMNQRTEVALQSARSGDTIRLSWGDVIVEAADQGSRNLRVVTRDSIASVKGTVFAVSSGTAGSLVSVVEGSVEVSQANGANLLHAGEQAASSLAIGEVSVTQAVSWSGEAADYSALLSELAQIEEQLALSGPSMRTDSGLLAYLPADTSAYFAIPNLDGTIAEAINLMDQRVSQSTTLMEWWTSAEGQELRRTLQDLQSVAAMLGDELVLTLSGGDDPVPLFLAETRSNTAEQILQAIRTVDPDADEMPPVQVVDGVLLASDSAAHLALLSAQLGLGSGSPFAAEIERHYDRGVGWLGAVDVAAFSAELTTQGTELKRALGLSSMRYLFFEQRSSAAGDESEATLSFAGERDGMASWLAAPGAIGSAEYVSSGAIAAIASSTKDPVEAFDQLMSLAGGSGEIMDDIRDMEAETGISIRDDIAASLGTDFVISIEGLAVTTPQWIAAFEVMNAGALDDAIRRIVERINADEADTDFFELNLTEESVNGRNWKILQSIGPSENSTSTAITWTYDRGYAIVSTDRATAERAISVRDTGSSLIRTAAFQQQFPGGGGVHNSGFLWLDLGRAGEAMQLLGQESGALARNADPVLVVVTGEDDRIRWATRSRLTSLIFDLLML